MLFFYVIAAVQIVLESFPVSSSGHLALLKIFACNYDVMPHSWRACSDFFLTEHGEYLLHLPTIFVSAWFFRTRWLWLVHTLPRCWRIIIKIVLLTCCADVVTSILYGIRIVTGFTLPLGCGFLITALLLASLVWCPRYVYTSWNVRKALILGFVQGIALMPGISRLAATYVSGRWLGLAEHKALEISFLIQWPLLVAACIRSIYCVHGTGYNTQFLNPVMALVMLVASVGAVYGLHVTAYLSSHNRWWYFACYMSIPSIVWFMVR